MMPRGNFQFTVSHVLIAVLLIAVLSMGYVLITKPGAVQESLERTAATDTGTGDIGDITPTVEVQPVTNEEEAGEALTGIASDIKGLSGALEEIDQSLE